VERTLRQEVFQTKIEGLLPTLQDWRESLVPILRSSVLGYFMGVIPGISLTIPTFITYTIEKKLRGIPRNSAQEPS